MNRLGSKGDAAELKAHAFFSSIDWEALSRKEVTPPFKPDVESDECTNNFDPEFTSADLKEVGVDYWDDEFDDVSAFCLVGDLVLISTSRFPHNRPMRQEGKYAYTTDLLAPNEC